MVVKPHQDPVAASGTQEVAAKDVKFIPVSDDNTQSLLGQSSLDTSPDAEVGRNVVAMDVG